jgi:hypothetical protein
MHKAKWTDPGSVALFQHFFRDREDPLVISVLRHCLRTGNLQIGPNAFLGRGTEGFVFKAQPCVQSTSASPSSSAASSNSAEAGTPMPCALKIEPFGSSDIEERYNLHLEAAKAGAPVAEVAPDTFFHQRAPVTEVAPDTFFPPARVAGMS